jgi:hypothetical protein
MGFLLFLVSVILSAVMYPLALLASIIINVLHPKTALDKLNQQFVDIAVSVDVTGNVVCDDLMNQIWIKKDGYKFGNRKETISSVLGKNQLTHKLTWLGWIIAKTLDVIEKDHCFNSIDEKV